MIRYRARMGAHQKSRWRAVEEEAIADALRHRWALRDEYGKIDFLLWGWIEMGLHDAKQNKMIRMTKTLDGRALPVRNRPAFP